MQKVNNKSEQSFIVTLPNENASKRFAKQLALSLPSSAILTFSGEIGSGKTTLIRALLKQLGVKSVIKSPSFSLVETYNCNSLTIHHFDLYRIQEDDELEYIGFRDYFSEHSLCCIEWPEHAGQLLPHVDIQFNLKTKKTGREMQIDACSALGVQISSGLVGEW